MKNEKGISLIALIITIIVIIILAAIVIGSVLNAPDQANFAKYCQDYSEIQSAVQTQAAIVFGEKALDTAGYTMQNAYREVCAGGTGTDTSNDKTVKSDKYIKIAPNGTNKLGLSSLPNYVDWYVNVATGELVSTKFDYEGGYNNPQGPKTYPDSDTTKTFDELLTAGAGA